MSGPPQQPTGVEEQAICYLLARFSTRVANVFYRCNNSSLSESLPTGASNFTVKPTLVTSAATPHPQHPSWARMV